MSFLRRDIMGTDTILVEGLSLKVVTYGEPFRRLSEVCHMEMEPLPGQKHKQPTFYVDSFNLKSVLSAVPQLDEATSFLRTENTSGISDLLNWPSPKLDPRLYPYQVEGVNWLLKRKSGMLCDEMGLGKTIQALQFMENSPYRRTLIVCPASMLHTWEAEIADWSPSWLPFVVDSLKILKQLDEMDAKFEMPTAVIMSWAILARGTDSLLGSAMDFDFLVVDESHYAKSFKAKRTKAICRLSQKMSSVVLLTGTPLRNCAMDLFPQLYMVAPQAFPDFNEFAERYSPPREKVIRSSAFRVYDQSLNMDELRERVRPYLIFRKKKDVLKDLPSRRHRRVDLAPSRSLEAEWETILDNMRSDSTESIDGGDLISHRQQVGKEKAKKIAPWIDDNSSPMNPLVVFLVHKKVRMILERELRARGIHHAAIVGDTPPAMRHRHIRDFQEGKIQVLICSEAGKEGITLTRACGLVQLERFWTPADEEQAEARIWRIGQKRPVIITNVHMRGTIDDFMVSKLARKRKVVSELFEDTLYDEELLLQFMDVFGVSR